MAKATNTPRAGKSGDQYSASESQQRFEAALKSGLNTPATPLTDMSKEKGHKSGKSPLPKPQKRPKGT
jgi:hypothetical protein